MPPSKHPAKPISCGECRRLKVRCDLKFPCANCCKRGLASICPQGELKNGLRGQRVLAGTEDLHRRIASLETALRETSSTHPLLLESSSAVTYSHAGSGQGLHTGRTAYGAEDLERSSTAINGSGGTDTLASFNDNHLVMEDDVERTRYFGAASSVYLSDIRSSPRQRRAALLPSDEPHLFNLPLPRSVGTNQIREAMQYLPDRQEAERLGDVYYNTFGWFTNIVPRSSWHVKFLDPTYHSVSPSPQRVAVLFLILALGESMDTPVDPHSVSRYANAARLAFAVDPSHSVTLVQAIYLYVTYIMNGRRDRPGGEVGWPFLRSGMAVVEALGMHRDPSHWDLDEDASTERRIVFWEIHGYDVLQSIALGRGQCVADYAIDCQLPEDGDETCFHSKTYALTRIWSRINERQIRTSASTYTEVCAIDDMINEYERNLPIHLSTMAPPSLLDLSDANRRRTIFRRTQLLMYVAEARMALHRGWYVRVLKQHSGEPMQSLQARSYICCLEACRTIVSLVRNALALPEQHIQRRWHFYFHLFSACACLAACVIRAPKSALARPILAELEHGVELFRVNKREETDQLDRLRVRATAAIRGEHSGALDAETEDLDLLGASKTFRRDTVPLPPLVPVASEQLDFGLPWSGDVQNIDVQAGSGGMVGAGAFDMTLGPGMPLQPFAAAFDMDAFLEELGLSSPMS